MSFKGICTVRTPDHGIRYFAEHTPVEASPGVPFQLNVKPAPQPNQLFEIRLRVCARCGLTYTNEVARDFTKGVPAPTNDNDDPVTS